MCCAWPDVQSPHHPRSLEKESAAMDQVRQADIDLLEAERTLVVSLLNGLRANALAPLEDIARLEARLTSLDKRLREAARDP